jgi:hypothetical protein
MARFFGGDSDGAEFPVYGNKGLVLVPTTNRENLSRMYEIDDPMAEGPIKVDKYRLERIAGLKHTFEVYIHSDMSIDLMLHRVIQNYRTIPEERQIPERKTFESMIKGKNLPTARHLNGDGNPGEYKHCAVQLAWESWLESAGYSLR